MRLFSGPIRLGMPSCVLLAVVLWPELAVAQVHEVVVGITPTCPYGIKACWAGAYEALGRIEGVQSVFSAAPDAYNCTASVRLKAQALPDPEKWAASFKTMVDKAYVFRGVELTVEGAVLERAGDQLVLRVPGVADPIASVPLGHKLQWNFKKAAARQAEPDERDAMAQLARKAKDGGDTPFKVQITGPFMHTKDGYFLEIREFVPIHQAVHE